MPKSFIWIIHAIFSSFVFVILPSKGIHFELFIYINLLDNN
jgi:hypothetical protein